jgi:hypothetical protein
MYLRQVLEVKGGGVLALSLAWAVWLDDHLQHRMMKWMRHRGGG